MAVLLGLLFAAGLTIRGRLPVPHAAPRDPGADSPASTVGVIVLLSVSLLVMAIAMINRKPGPPRPPGREFADGPRGTRTRWNLRLGLIALGLLIAWLLAVVVLNRLGLGPENRQVAVPMVPDDAGSSAPAAPTRAPAKGGDTYRLLTAATAVLVVMTVVATVGAAVRRPRPQAPPALGDRAAPVPPAAPEPLAVAAELGLAQVANRNLAPREAIIACYAAMEQALAGAPEAAPQASDTPSEVLARAVGNRALSPEAASELVAVFTEARFSTHVMTEDHRQTAERALRSVLAELEADVGTPV